MVSVRGERGSIIRFAGDIINIVMRQMKSLRFGKMSFTGLLGALVYVGSSGLLMAQSADLTRGNIVIRGSLVCLNSAGSETPCTGKEGSFGLKDAAGKVYDLKSGNSLDTLRNEPRIQSKDFQLTLRQIQGSSLYEIIKSRFFRDGKLYDFYYYCDVCNITTYHPGLCMCCRQETQYRENVVQ